MGYFSLPWPLQFVCSWEGSLWKFYPIWSAKDWFLPLGELVIVLLIVTVSTVIVFLSCEHFKCP